MLAVLLPSAQTFINITSQPGEKPTSNLDREKGKSDIRDVFPLISMFYKLRIDHWIISIGAMITAVLTWRGS